MKSVGVKEFRDKATHYLASAEAIAIKRHDRVIGYYFPVKQPDETRFQKALAQFEKTLADIYERTGLDEETLADALDSTKPYPPYP